MQIPVIPELLPIMFLRFGYVTQKLLFFLFCGLAYFVSIEPVIPLELKGELRIETSSALPSETRLQMLLHWQS